MKHISCEQNDWWVGFMVMFITVVQTRHCLLILEDWLTLTLTLTDTQNTGSHIKWFLYMLGNISLFRFTFGFYHVTFRSDRDRPLITPQRRPCVPAVIRGRGAVGTGFIFRDRPVRGPTDWGRLGLMVGRHFDSLDRRVDRARQTGWPRVLRSWVFPFYWGRRQLTLLRYWDYGRGVSRQFAESVAVPAHEWSPRYPHIYPDYFPF